MNEGKSLLLQYGGRRTQQYRSGNDYGKTLAVCKSVHLQIVSVVMSSSPQGDIVLELYWKHAPRTCRNMTTLVGVRSCCPMSSMVMSVYGSHRVLMRRDLV